ncbi:MAG: hypothetical protein ACRDHZ_01305 [Ktedonobacteraceae bacterium]
MQGNVTGAMAPSAKRFHVQHIVDWLKVIRSVFVYIFFFQWVVDLARWLVTTGGNIAESAFLLATVYVTINTVAHQLVLWVMPASVIVTVNQISVIAFSVLPELIIFAAIKVTFDHGKMALLTKRIDSWVWAVLYFVPTAVFLVLTVVTISSFVSVEATNVNAPQATGLMLVIRCLAGWSYGMLQMLWAKLGYEGYSDLFTRLRSEIAGLTETLKLRDGSIAGLEDVKGGLSSELAVLAETLKNRDAALVNLRDEVVNLGRMVKGRDELIVALRSELEDVQEQSANLDAELIDTRIALAHANRKARLSDNGADEGMITSDSPVVTTEKYRLVKEHMQAAILGGERVNMRKIAIDTKVHYNTVRRYAESIVEELTRQKVARSA